MRHSAQRSSGQMRIVNRVEFLKLPPETLYAPYQHCAFGDLAIKGETLNNDWYYQQISDAIESTGSDDFADKLFESAETGNSIPMDFDCQGRDGCFEPDTGMFAVYEPQDVQFLINRLKRCLESDTAGGK